MHDVLVVALAWLLAFHLRFNFDLPEEYVSPVWRALFWVVPLYAGLFYLFGLYRGIWRYASLSDLQHLMASVLLGALLVTLLVVIFGIGMMPRSVLLLHPMLLALVMGGSRFVYRSWKEHRLYGPSKLRGNPVVILGAGEAADSLLREIHRSGQWYPVAIIDDNQNKAGRWLRGLPISGPIDTVSEVAARLGAEHAIIAMPDARPAERRRAAELAAAAGLTVMTVPSYDDLLSGRMTVSNVRKVELEDLLGRDPVSIDTAHVVEMIAGKTILVTGAGGSIGSELCRQLARFKPARLILVELSEFALYSVEQWFVANVPEQELVPLAGDVKDVARIEEIFAAWRPQAVFHAAAYKHVPLMEVGNAWQAVRNNVLGTLTVAECAMRFHAERFALISTDKAVNPTNVMGATKRLAEMVCEALHRQQSGTQFEMVRFGNVLGSTGSVIPKFQEQIGRGGPVTVTHPDITRYFMSIPEAAQLVLQAATMGLGGEIFVLDMGEPVKIVDLARKMINLSGYTENDIHIEFSGLRPGEKLYEELLADAEQTRETPHPKLRIARARAVDESFLANLRPWLAKSSQDDDLVREALMLRVPEYRPATHIPEAAAATAA